MVMSNEAFGDFESDAVLTTKHGKQGANIVPGHTDTCPDTPLYQVLYDIKLLLRPFTDHEPLFIQQCQNVSYEVQARYTPATRIPQLGLALRCLGHQVLVRRVASSSAYWTRSISAPFLVVRPFYGTNFKSTTEYIVDPGLKERFQIGFTTLRYSDVLEAVPNTFVGTAETLARLVKVLCSEMRLAFDSHGIPRPPWRSYQSTISCWVLPTTWDVAVPMATHEGEAAPDVLAFVAACEQMTCTLSRGSCSATSTPRRCSRDVGSFAHSPFSQDGSRSSKTNVPVVCTIGFRKSAVCDELTNELHSLQVGEGASGPVVSSEEFEQQMDAVIIIGSMHGHEPTTSPTTSPTMEEKDMQKEQQPNAKPKFWKRLMCWRPSFEEAVMVKEAEEPAALECKVETDDGATEFLDPKLEDDSTFPTLKLSALHGARRADDDMFVSPPTTPKPVSLLTQRLRHSHFHSYYPTVE